MNWSLHHRIDRQHFGKNSAKGVITIFYKILEDQLRETDLTEWQGQEDGIAVLSGDEWEAATDIRANYLLGQREDNIHFCKLESHLDYLFGTFHIPVKGHYRRNDGFVFYVLERRIIFIDDTGIVANEIKKVGERRHKQGYTLERFLYDFLISLIDDDLLYLSSVEKKIAEMEEQILASEEKDFNYEMLRLKKEISRMHRYYSQMADMGEMLRENEMDFLDEKEVTCFGVFTDRAGRLREETQVLREYAMQVQDVYQSEIGIRQNDVMKVLTVVTTVFLPLTLIAGWYGMNFAYMPELAWKYGYPAVVVLSILVVVVSLRIFKKKKYL